MTSLVAKKDFLLATRIEEAIRKNESLEALTADNLRTRTRTDVARAKISSEQKRAKPKNKKTKEVESVKNASSPQTSGGGRKTSVAKSGKASSPSSSFSSSSSSSPTKPQRTVKISKPSKPSSAGAPGGGSKRSLSGKTKQADSSKRRSSTVKSSASKLSVVGFRGRRSSSKPLTKLS